jgi:hypothetical protein
VTDYLAQALEQAEEERERETAEALIIPSMAVRGALERGGTTSVPGKSGGQEDALTAGDTGEDSSPEETARKRGEDAQGVLEQVLTAMEEPLEEAKRFRLQTLTAQESRRVSRDTGPAEGESGWRALEGIELLTALRRADTGTEFVRGQRRNVTVTLPEAAPSSAQWSPEALDRVVERDARRYDGGRDLY